MDNVSRERGCVLCIGSDVLTLYFRRLFLKRKGYRVLTAASGHAGLRLFAREAVHAVVLDHDVANPAIPLIAGEIKRLSPHTPTILLVEEFAAKEPLPYADIVVPRTEEKKVLPKVLEKTLMRTLLPA